MFVFSSGHLLSEWYIDTDMTSNEFFIIPNHGKVDTGKSGLLNVFYIPRSKGEHNLTVILRVVGNQTKFTLRMFGCGLEPSLSIKDTVLTFKPALPFSTANTMFFNIQNVSNFPIQYCFPDFDKSVYY